MLCCNIHITAQTIEERNTPSISMIAITTTKCRLTQESLPLFLSFSFNSPISLSLVI